MNGSLGDGAELLFRQIHPDCMMDGQPGSDRFMPSARDLGRLSLDRSSLTTVSDSYTLYVSSGKLSCAVFGLTVGEFSAENICCYFDPTELDGEHPANPAHALADYCNHDPKRYKLVAKRLKRIAVERGQLYPA